MGRITENSGKNQRQSCSNPDIIRRLECILLTFAALFFLIVLRFSVSVVGGVKSAFFFLLFSVHALVAAGQAFSSSFVPPDSIYGADPLLHNGKIYHAVFPPGTVGNPFLNGPDFVPGSLTLRGQVYEEVSLKLDIFHQKLVLGFTNLHGAPGQLIVSDAALESFRLPGKLFVPFPQTDSTIQYLQLIGNQDFAIAFKWHKKLELDSRVGATNRVFSDPKRQQYLLRNKQLMPFKNKRSFLKLFSQHEQAEVKQLLRKYRIKVKNSPDQNWQLFTETFLKSFNP